MLNPPLSLLSDDLLVSIVEQLAKFPFADENLNNLSLADRAFTESCQKYIFRELILGNGRNISKQLTKVKMFLDGKPSFANRVRMVQLSISSEETASLFEDPNFTSILQLFAKSPMPPNELHFSGLASVSSTIEDPMLVTRQLAESFFSQTLTVLRLRKIANVPLPLFLICPRLREVVLDQVEATDKSYNTYPDDQCFGREAPLLEVLEYRHSYSLVEQMITPPPRFSTPVVLWSNLRVLTLAPHDKEGMACLQPILDAACNTLEELYLTGMHVGESRHLPVAGLVNLSNIPNLQVFSLYTIIYCKLPRRGLRNAPLFAALHDINIVLGTITESNRITNLWLDFLTIGRRPFDGCLNQDWVEMFNEIIRIGGGKPLELELKLAVSSGTLSSEHSGQDELYMRIMEKAALLSDHPNICTHWWNPTLSTRGIGPFPRGQVRTRCRR